MIRWKRSFLRTAATRRIPYDRTAAGGADGQRQIAGGFTRLGYESTFREYCDRFTPDYLAAVREAGESELPALADSLLDALEAQWKQARFWNRTTVRGETKQVVVGYLTPMLMADQELRPFAGVLRDRWNLRWPKDVYHAAGYERICKGFKLRILGFEVPEKKKEAPLDDEI